MGESKRCITRDSVSGKFIVEKYEVGDRPNNFVIAHAQYNNLHGISYRICNTDIDVFWTYGTYQGNHISFRKDGVVIKRFNNPNLSSVADYLNRFNEIDKVELDKLVLTAKEEKKDNLSLEIENLQKEKSELEKEISNYKQVITKVKELIELTSK